MSPAAVLRNFPSGSSLGQAMDLQDNFCGSASVTDVPPASLLVN